MAIPIPDPASAVGVATNLVTLITNHVTVVSNVLVTTTNVVSHDITGLDVVNNVNTLYSSVFSSFLVMIGVIAGIVGVVIPLLLQRNQRQEGKLQEERLNADFQQKITSAKDEFDAKLKKLESEKNTIESKLRETEIRIEAQLASARASAAHLDAQVSFERGNYVHACRASIYAARKNLAAKDEENLARSIVGLTLCLGKLTVDQLEEADLKNRFSNLEAELKAFNATGSLAEKIGKFFKAKEEMLKQEK